MKEKVSEETKRREQEQKDFDWMRMENLRVLEEKEWKLRLEEERIEREKEILRKERELQS